MIYALLFFEFFKIGLFAIGGGLVTVPFLFDLAEHYPWFTSAELGDMIAISESTPGPLGVNMATFAGYKAAGIPGAFTATLGLVTPSVIIIMAVSCLLKRFSSNPYVQNVLLGIRPAVIALIFMAGWEIARISVLNVTDIAIFAVFLAAIHFYKTSPVYYMILAAVVGIALKL